MVGISRKKAVESADTKPQPLAVMPDHIPEELKALSRWVCWRYEPRKDQKTNKKKWTKPPINAKTGGKAVSTDSSTWCDFATVWARYQSGSVDGIGIVLGDGLAGVDLDDCRDPETCEL